MDRVLRNLRILLRAQSGLLEHTIDRAGRQAALLAVAGVAGLFGLAMLDVAGFLALAPLVGPGWSALLVAVGNFLIAGILVALALKADGSAEAAGLREARDLALADLESGLQTVGGELGQVRQFMADPVGTFGPALAGPAILGLIRRLRQRRRRRRRRKDRAGQDGV